jgi:hypothetical protein
LAVWQGEAADFRDCLDSLFRLTPPTALFLDRKRGFMMLGWQAFLTVCVLSKKAQLNLRKLTIGPLCCH